MRRGQPAACVRTLVGHDNWIHSLAFAPDGTQLASGSWDSTVKLWDVASGRVLQTLTGHTQRIYLVAWSPDGHTLASASFDQTIWLWDVAQKRYRVALHGHTAAVYCLAFTPDSSRLLSGSEDSTIRVWDVDSGECVRTLQGYAVCFYGLDWSPAGSHLVSGSTDGLVSVWREPGQKSPRVLGAHHWLVHDVAWSPDGRWIASCGWDNAICLWEPTTGACLSILLAETLNRRTSCSLGRPGVPMGSGSPVGVISKEYTSGISRSAAWHIVEQTSQIVFRDIAWSPDGTRLASGSNDGSVCLWDIATGTLQQRLPGHQGIVMRVAGVLMGHGWPVLGDGRSGGELLVWDVQSGKCVRSFAGQPALVFAVTWDLSGDLLVSGDSDGTLRWWDVPRGSACRCARRIRGSSGRSGEVPMVGGWPVVEMTGRSGSGICTVANLSAPCGATAPTNDSTSPGSGG